MPIKNDKGETEARIFFMAYTLERGPGRREARPLMFSFNGGPGSSSVWLHLGALGAEAGADARRRRDAAAALSSWSTTSTPGWTRPTSSSSTRSTPATAAPPSPSSARSTAASRSDIESVGEFIRLYLTRYERWASPLFLVGESYGTIRAAGLAGLPDREGHRLQRHRARLQRSSTCRPPASTTATTCPTPLPADLRRHRLVPQAAARRTCRRSRSSDVLRRGRSVGGRRLPDRAGEGRPPEPPTSGGGRRARLARYTGLSQTLRRAEQPAHRDPALLQGAAARRGADRRPARQPLHRASTRCGVAETPDFDPSMTRDPPALHRDASTTTCAAELGYETDAEYHILRGVDRPTGTRRGDGYADTSEALARRLRQEPLHAPLHRLRLLRPGDALLRDRVHAVPHGPRPVEQRARISTGQYEAGHMMYIHEGELARLKQDVAKFLAGALVKP